MAMTMQERKAKQRSTPLGYGKSRMVDWKLQGIKDADYTVYLEKIVDQHSRCDICGCVINNHAPLDHNHKNGLSRGVLCADCNLLLGKVEMNKAFLLHAEAYLEKWDEAA